MELPTAYVLGVNAATSEAYSARPDAPVVPAKPRPQRVRMSLSKALYRAARTVEPRETWAT